MTSSRKIVIYEYLETGLLNTQWVSYVYKTTVFFQFIVISIVPSYLTSAIKAVSLSNSRRTNCTKITIDGKTKTLNLNLG